MKHIILFLGIFLGVNFSGICQMGEFVQKLDSQNIIKILPLSETIFEEAGYKVEFEVKDFEGYKQVITTWYPFVCTAFDSDFMLFKSENSGFRCVYHERNIGYGIGDLPMYEPILKDKKLLLYTYFRNGTTIKEVDLSLLPNKNAIKWIDEEPKKWVVVISTDKSEEHALFELRKAEKLNKGYTGWILKKESTYRTMIEFSKKQDAENQIDTIRKTFPTAYIKNANSLCDFRFVFWEILECN
jgi:hypothetical protein